MERTDVVVVLAAALVLVVTAKPLKKVPTWHIAVLAVLLYPVDRVLLSALESAGIVNSPWSKYPLLISVTFVFTVLTAPVVRGYKARRDRRAGRQHHDQDHDQHVDA
ncbi:hypothetical protein [Streptomyces prasinopilosus]|uniref:Uncharacterized protein n=1 Tax=Streptomyces prasinopilosus TaxID=67344 RepID=A0A1G6TP79_9ACTN|nr:hypothetical protein [Streptomyces prasinopilosus]SDD30286.1 hypothetical protein SAMN05216505_106254 [Streptomyces prasinopilosus]